VGADPRIEPDALDDLPGVQPAGGRVGVELVEVRHPQRQIGVGEQLDRLGLGRVGQQHRCVVFDRAFEQQIGEQPAGVAAVADHDP